MTNVEGNPNDEARRESDAARRSFRHSVFVIDSSFVIRISACLFADEQEQEQEHEWGARLGIGTERSMDSRWLGSQLSSPRPGLIMIVGATEERHLVEHVLLEPFQPEIDDWCDK